MTASKRSTKRFLRNPDDAPALTGHEMSRKDAKWRIAEKRVPPAKAKAAFRDLLGKRQVNMMLDNAVVAHFKARAGGRGYQTLINEALREAMHHETLEKALRRIVREELGRR